jgi:carbonic anhydrase
MKQRVGLVDNWLRHIQDVYQKYDKYLGDTLPPRMKYDCLCELNVITVVCRMSVRRRSFRMYRIGKQPLTVHGRVYGVHDELILRFLDGRQLNG